MDKSFLYLIILAVIICFTGFLKAGIPSSSNKFKSAVDLCVDEGLKDINIEDTKVVVPGLFNTYGSTALIDGFSFHSAKDEKITDVAYVENRVATTVVQLVHMLNNIPSIRPYLLRFPLTVSDVRYTLNFTNKQTDFHYYEPLIALGYFNGRSLEVDVLHNPKLANPLPIEADIVGRKTILKKPLDDTPKLCALKSVSVPRTSIACQEIKYIKSIPDNFCSSSRREFFKYFDRYIAKSGFKIACLTDAADPKKDGTYRPIAAGMWSYRKIDINEAKSLAKGIFADWFTWASNNPETIKSIEENKEQGTLLYSGTDRICFRITFWDEYFNRVEEPYIAQILCQDSMIEYYTADEGQRLVKVFEEPVPNMK